VPARLDGTLRNTAAIDAAIYFQMSRIYGAEMVGAEHHRCTDLRFSKAVSARRRMVGDLAMQEIPGVITSRR